jgi:hypothetical protein
MPVLVGGHLIDVDGELVEGHRPSDGTRGVAGNAGMGHHHHRAATDVLEFDANLRRRRMPLGQAR